MDRGSQGRSTIHDPRPQRIRIGGENRSRYYTSDVAVGKLHSMNMHELIRELREDNDSKIVLLVADGLGGLAAGAGRQDRAGNGPHAEPRRLRPGGRVRPEHPGSAGHHAGQRAGPPRPVRLRSAANTASAAAFSKRSASTSRSARATWPCAATSAPSTTAGLITDRRAGRPTTERCVAMCQLLQDDPVPGVEVFVEPVREHRFVVVFRGDGPRRRRQRHRSAADRRTRRCRPRARTPPRRRRPRPSIASSPRRARCSRTRRRPTW